MKIYKVSDKESTSKATGEFDGVAIQVGDRIFVVQEYGKEDSKKFHCSVCPINGTVICPPDVSSEAFPSVCKCLIMGEKSGAYFDRKWVEVKKEIPVI